MSGSKRIIFLGSPEFAVPSLQALIESIEFKPVAVVTQPDRPVGRSNKPQPTPVKQLALLHGIPVFQPEDINTMDAVVYLESLSPDMLVTVAYGELLVKVVRDLARFGAINLHPSLLPQLRGAAPIPFAIWQGMNYTGITIFKLTSRMDAGPIYQQRKFFIFPSENCTDLTERLAHLGAKELLSFLQSYFTQPWQPTPQDENQASYCRKIEKEDCIINWHLSQEQVHNHIRAMSLTPGAYSYLRGNQLKILWTEKTEASSSYPPGTITAIVKNEGFRVQTLDKELLVKLVQPAGKKQMSAWAYHLGAHLKEGEFFSSG